MEYKLPILHRSVVAADATPPDFADYLVLDPSTGIDMKAFKKALVYISYTGAGTYDVDFYIGSAEADGKFFEYESEYTQTGIDGNKVFEINALGILFISIPTLTAGSLKIFISGLN